MTLEGTAQPAAIRKWRRLYLVHLPARSMESWSRTKREVELDAFSSRGHNSVTWCFAGYLLPGLNGPVQNRSAATLQAQQRDRCSLLFLLFSLLEAARVMGKERARTAALRLLGLSLRGCFSLCDA